MERHNAICTILQDALMINMYEFIEIKGTEKAG